jgi:hypothetical protein
MPILVVSDQMQHHRIDSCSFLRLRLFMLESMEDLAVCHATEFGSSPYLLID